MIPASSPGGTGLATQAAIDASILLHRGDSPDLKIVSLAELMPVVTGNPPLIGDVPYRSWAVGATAYFQRAVPQSWPSCQVGLILAKNFDADGIAVLECSSLSDDSNQLSSGQSPATASAHISTNWTVPAGSTNVIQHTFIEVPVATIQVFETPTPTWCNFVIGYPGGGSFGAHAIALAGVTLRRSVP